MNVASAEPIPPRNRKLAEHSFFGGMAMIILITVFIGFAPTFYLTKWMAPPHPMLPLTPLVILHGSAFTGWILLLVLQSALVTGGRTDLHRRLGIFGACLAAAMVALGVVAAVYGAHRGSNPPGTEPLHFLAIPLFDMLVFALLVFMGVRARRDPPAHKRLMLLATLGILDAAVARWPLAIMQSGPIAFFGVTDLFLLPLVAYDLLTLGRIHRATLWGMVLILVSQPLRLVISDTGAWLAFARWAVSLVS
jgi:hypothetical protein